jgi:hypothetical protein
MKLDIFAAMAQDGLTRPFSQ